jgi:hypothetical protein
MLSDMVARGWHNFLVRHEGPLNLRFILQPTVAIAIALRAGLRDARAGRPPFLWAAVTNPTARQQLLHGGWRDMRTTFLIAAAIDAVYQIMIHRSVYPLELLFTATLLALVPYLMLRGPVNRIAQRFRRSVDKADQ